MHPFLFRFQYFQTTFKDAAGQLAHRFDDVVVALGDKVVLQGVGGVRAILNGWICQAVADGEAFEVDWTVRVLLSILVESKADSGNIVPAYRLHNTGSTRFVRFLQPPTHVTRAFPVGRVVTTFYRPLGIQHMLSNNGRNAISAKESYPAYDSPVM